MTSLLNSRSQEGTGLLQQGGLSVKGATSLWREPELPLAEHDFGAPRRGYKHNTVQTFHLILMSLKSCLCILPSILCLLSLALEQLMGEGCSFLFYSSGCKLMK